MFSRRSYVIKTTPNSETSHASRRLMRLRPRRLVRERGTLRLNERSLLMTAHAYTRGWLDSFASDRQLIQHHSEKVAYLNLAYPNAAKHTTLAQATCKGIRASFEQGDTRKPHASNAHTTRKQTLMHATLRNPRATRTKMQP